MSGTAAAEATTASGAGAPDGDARRVTNTAIRDRLRDLVQTLPVPTTPRPRSRGDEELGLGILELSMRLSHVSRLTEHLELVQRGHLGRRISLDVDLQTLSRRHRDVITADTADGTGDFLWVPIARYDRRDLAAVVVTDGQGDVVPRLTNREATRITISAVQQLFRMLLDADSRAYPRAEILDQLRTQDHQARWLIESAITTFIEQGLPPGPHLTSRGARDRQGERHEGQFGTLPDGRRAAQWPRRAMPPVEHVVRLRDEPTSEPRADSRELAVHALSTLFDPIDESTFLPLLHLAATEHPLVVLLPCLAPKQYLSFEAPHLRARREPARVSWRRSLWGALSPRQEFTMEYETSIPRSVNSFHVSLTVAPEAHVRHCFMSTSSDLATVQTLRADLDECARRSAELLGNDHGAVLELELDSIAARLRDLGGRRAHDVSKFRSAWNVDFHDHLTRPTPAPAESGEHGEPVVDPDHPVCSLARFGYEYSVGAYSQLTGVTLDERRLRDTAEVLDRLDLGWDVILDNDPREDHAHLHWRRAEQVQGSRPTDPLDAHVVVTLADDPPSLAAAVCRMTLALTFLLAGVVAFLDHGLIGLVPWANRHEHGSFESPEGALTLLLLVPGLLLSRLDLPDTNTVLGHLRMLPRVAAYAAVTVTTVIAGYVGLRRGHVISMWPLADGAWILLGIGLYVALSLRAKADGVRRRVPRSAMIPRWLARECTPVGVDLEPDLPPSARFEVVAKGIR